MEKCECEIQLCNIMRKKCKNILGNVYDELDSIKGIKKNLYQLINSLQKFENTPFADYEYLPIMLPLNMALDMMKEKDSTIELEEVYEYFYDFMKAFNLCVQNSNRSDRQFIQTPEFNIRLYDIPAKMYAFYYAYVYNLREFLNIMSDNDPKHEYEFLICQGITNSLRVKECFKKMSNSEGLFIVQIPERAAYEPQTMLLTLTHELGHVVGTQLRQRDKRAETLKTIACKVVCEYAKIKWANRERAEGMVTIEDEYWSKLESNLQNMVFSKEPVKSFEEAILEKPQLVRRAKERENYGSYVIKKIMYYMISYIYINKQDIYRYLMTKQYIEWLDKDPEKAEKKANELLEELVEYIGSMGQNNFWNRDDFNLENVLKMALKLMRECLADIICIMTLRLSMQKYLEEIVINLVQLGHVDFERTEILLRSSLVTRCMLDVYDDLGEQFTWSDDSLNDIKDELQIKLKEKIVDTIKVYLPMEEDTTLYCEQNREVRSALGMLYTPSILKEIARYLTICRKVYISYCVPGKMDKEEEIEKKKKTEKKRKQLQEVYEMFDKSEELSVQNIVVKQQEYIESYLVNLKEKMQKLGETSDGNK